MSKSLELLGTAKHFKGVMVIYFSLKTNEYCGIYFSFDLPYDTTPLQRK